MTQMLSLAPRQMDIAPIQPSMDLNELSRRGHSEAAFGGLHDSSSPIAEAMMRRPPVSVGTPNTHQDLRDHHLRLSTATAPHPDAGQDTMCLCTPTPKIPRPRNAFILYRQHHQSKVTAENPRLSNPDISKIIGDRWRSEVSEIKAQWKRLAEEEKQRHQHQYPNYRYQPRRNKGQNGAGSTAADESGRCSRCNGRLIATPQTPSTPVTASSAHGLSYSEPHARLPLERLNTDVPRRTSIELSPLNRLSTQGRHPLIRSPDDLEPASPEPKRRRTNGTGDYHLASGRPDFHPAIPPADATRLLLDGGPATPARQYPFNHLQELASLPRSRSFPMPPPPRPWAGNDQDGNPRRGSLFDESLRLPPIQTAISPSPSRPSTDDHRNPGISSTGSPAQRRQPPVRNMDPEDIRMEIMSYPFNRKVAALAAVSRPAPPLRRDGQPPRVRGPFIAVEGPAAPLIQQVGQAVERELSYYGDLAVRTWSRNAGSSSGTGATASAPRDSISSALQTTLSWREASSEIVDYITGVTAPAEQSSDEPAAHETHATMPIALVKDGYSLTFSDRFACTTYRDSTADTWKWVAGLWHGAVSPDLVIYVKPCDDKEMRETSPVEIFRQTGILLVRIPQEGGLDQATERRLSFELVEWLKAASFCNPVPPNWRREE